MRAQARKPRALLRSDIVPFIAELGPIGPISRPIPRTTWDCVTSLHFATSGFHVLFAAPFVSLSLLSFSHRTYTHGHTLSINYCPSDAHEHSLGTFRDLARVTAPISRSNERSCSSLADSERFSSSRQSSLRAGHFNPETRGLARACTTGPRGGENRRRETSKEARTRPTRE